VKEKMNLKDKVNQFIQSYQIEAEHVSLVALKECCNTTIAIETGSNEGYYVVVTEALHSVALRFHNKNEALKCLGVMLQFLPNH
jgi:hypothetical protein